MRHTRRPHQPRGHAFTLVELLVVVAIIAILVGIGLAVGSGVLTQSERQLTDIALKGAMGISQEYIARTGVPVLHNDVKWQQSKYFNVPGREHDKGFMGDGDDTESWQDQKEHSIERFVYSTYAIEAIKPMYANLPQRLMGDSEQNGFLDLVDGWGSKMGYAASVPEPEDMLKRAKNGLCYYLPPYPRPFFASPGPDKIWGNPNLAYQARLDPSFKFSGGHQDRDRRAAAAYDNNLYSFQVQ